MNKFLKKLVENDCKLNGFNNNQEIIEQGLAPVLAISNPSTTLLKANLLEQSKYLNWQEKAIILFENFYKQNIKFLVLKGFAYSYLLYDQSHIRPYSDIDIFVHESDYDRAEKILIQLGYKKFQSRQGQFISYQNSFYDNNKIQATIDLHWQINNRIEFHQYFQFDQLIQTAIVIESPLMHFKTLNIIDAFILACCHYIGHRSEDRKHIWLYDLALLWHNMGCEIQKQAIQVAQQRQQSQIIHSVLNLLKSNFNNCIDANTFKTNAFENSQEYLHNRTNKVNDLKIKLKSIQGTKNKIKFISEYIFQSKNYVRNRYKLKSKTWVYLYYPRMWIEDSIKLFKK